MKKNVENVNITTGNPVGTIINFYGKTAPEGYLICDGETYNRADYPELAEHLVTNFEDLVGDGETTFKVPDLRGEFLRGTGTNSHVNSVMGVIEGSGASVGEHQSATLHVGVFGRSNSFGISKNGQSVGPAMPFADTTIKRDRYQQASSGETSNTGSDGYYTSRPTNTSVLYCIKY